MILSFSQGGLGLPERDYYFREGKDAETIRAAYVAHIARLLELAGDTPTSAKTTADSIMAFETKLAKASRSLVDLRDPEKNYNKLKRASLMELAPDLDWKGYFNTIAFPNNETNVLVRQPEFFETLNDLLTSEPLAVWRNYLRWRLLSETADYLSKRFVEEHFSFYGKILSGTTELKPRWKRVLAAEDAAIGEDLGATLCAKGIQPGRQSPRPNHGGLSPEGHARAHPCRQVDERGNQSPGLQKARHDAKQGGLSEQVARLHQTRPRTAVLCAKRAGRRSL